MKYRVIHLPKNSNLSYVAGEYDSEEVASKAIKGFNKLFPNNVYEVEAMSDIDDKLEEVIVGWGEYTVKQREMIITQIKQAFTDVSWIPIQELPSPHKWVAERTSDEYSTQYWLGWNAYHDLVIDAAKRASGLGENL